MDDSEVFRLSNWVDDEQIGTEVGEGARSSILAFEV